MHKRTQSALKSTPVRVSSVAPSNGSICIISSRYVRARGMMGHERGGGAGGGGGGGGGGRMRGGVGMRGGGG